MTVKHTSFLARLPASMRSARIMGVLALLCAAAAVWAADASHLGENSSTFVDSLAVYPDGSVRTTVPNDISGAGVSFLEIGWKLSDTTSMLTERFEYHFRVKCADRPNALDRAVFRSPETARAVARVYLEKSSGVARSLAAYKAHRYLTTEAIEEAITTGADSAYLSRKQLRWRGVGAIVIGLCALGFASVAILAMWPGLRAAYWRLYERRRCTACGYSVEGLGAGTCPECGAAIEGAGRADAYRVRSVDHVRRVRSGSSRAMRDPRHRPFLLAMLLGITAIVAMRCSTAIKHSGSYTSSKALAVLPGGRVVSAKSLRGTDPSTFSTVDASGTFSDTSEMFVERYSVDMRLLLRPIEGESLRSEKSARTIAEALISDDEPRAEIDLAALSRRSLRAEDIAGAIVAGTDSVRVSGSSVKWSLVIAIPSALASLCLFILAVARAWRRAHAEFRADMGEAVCRHCGYSMAEIEYNTCPECGRNFF